MCADYFGVVAWRQTKSTTNRFVAHKTRYTQRQWHGSPLHRKPSCDGPSFTYAMKFYHKLATEHNTRCCASLESLTIRPFAFSINLSGVFTSFSSLLFHGLALVQHFSAAFNTPLYWCAAKLYFPYQIPYLHYQLNQLTENLSEQNCSCSN
jgi:hypothetical protein